MLSKLHPAYCPCRRCFARVLTSFIQRLGERTETGVWQCFATITYSRIEPEAHSSHPTYRARLSPTYAKRLVDNLVKHIGKSIGRRIDFFVADHFGSVNARFHQHLLLAALDLDRYPRQDLEAWLRPRAGWSRFLPYRPGAARYLANYIARHRESNWDFRVGGLAASLPSPKTGTEILRTVDLPRSVFHNTLPRRHR